MLDGGRRIDAAPDAAPPDAGRDAGPSDAGTDAFAPSDAGCPIGTTRCAGACVDTQTSSLHCGACGDGVPRRRDLRARRVRAAGGDLVHTRDHLRLRQPRRHRLARELHLPAGRVGRVAVGHGRVHARLLDLHRRRARGPHHLRRWRRHHHRAAPGALVVRGLDAQRRDVQ
ncbi:MAG: hypothetical protein M5U28_01660 [Sandaracinaceae bacterium]|nr:hypothetical protein [Sandaracinaceae bacterium]